MTRQDRQTLAPALDASTGSVVTRSAGRIDYYCDARASGRPLLLLHSINAAPSAFEVKPLFDHYRKQRPVYAPDLPGFGLSQRSNIKYSPRLYADALVEFCTEVFDDGVDAVALSTTAEFLARAAHAAPGAFSSLAFISPTGLGERSPPSPRVSDRLERFFKLPVLSGGLYKVLTSRASIRYFLNLNFADGPPVEMIDYAYETAHQPNARYAPYRFLSMKLFTRDALESLYAPLSQPFLLLYDTDPNVGFEKLPALLQANDLARAARIAPTRGLPHWEELEGTTDALDSFWGDVHD